MDAVTSLDVSPLLMPFGPDAPAGVDPRDDTSPASRYFLLRDARADARASERASYHDGRSSGAEAQWRIVKENARLILTETGKDLEVAAWMTEASLRLHGLAGLAAGAELMANLISQFWSHGLFPLAEDGAELRGNPLAGLNGISGDGTLLQPLRMTVLFHRPDQTPVTLWQYEQAEEVEGIGDAPRKKRRLAAGVLPLQDLESEARLLGEAELRAIAGDAKAALTWWRQLAQLTDRIMGHEAPPSSRVAAILDKIIRVAAKLAPEPPSDPAVELLEVDMEISCDHNDVLPNIERNESDNRRPVTREDMLRNLLIIAEYFRTHEPHSPLAYTLEEAVRRARLSLIDLLLEVVPDATTRGAILSQLGIKSDT